jgi:hypothetical protein
MEYFYLYIFVLALFIISVAYYNTIRDNSVSYNLKEGFNPEKQHFILLGDSILKNDAYVSDGKSVSELLIDGTKGKTMCLAVDDTKINNVYEQINKIPDELNSRKTTVFLSIGGNDILYQYMEKEGDSSDSTILGTIFAAYKNLVKSIKNKLPNANIVLMDIYYPDNMKYKQYHTIIKKWNEMLYSYASENNFSVYKISNILTQQEDFTLDIEPSAIGSKKIVDNLLQSY